MKFMLFVLPTVPGTLEDRKRLRPIGRNNERYQQMLDELRKLAVFADDAGFDVIATTEHHFHSEGYETSVAPLLLYADLAARTKRIKFSPLGLVLPSWDPIRAAEELAVLDHLTKGRIYAGFARGYQDRWVNVLGQQYHVTGAPMDGSSIDNHNRKVYEETLKVIKKAWTEEAWDYDGEYYKVPYPLQGRASGAGRSPTGRGSTARPGEVDDEGVVRKICVVPKPYQQPHPPLFQPFSVSEIDHPLHRRSRASCRGSWWRIRRTSSASAGSIRRSRPRTAASSAWARASAPSGPCISARPRPRRSTCSATPTTPGSSTTSAASASGRRSAPRRTTRSTRSTRTRPCRRRSGRSTACARSSTRWPARWTRSSARSRRCRRSAERGELEWFGWFFDQGFMSWEEEERQIELFAKHIIPAFR